MLLGLQGAKEGDEVNDSKMSKSKPDSSIFVHDSMEEIERKLLNAFCPAKIAENNPVMEYCEYIIFPSLEKMEIKRPEKYGGNAEFHSYSELENAYVKGELHPLDLKKAAAESIESLVKPIRAHFEKEGKARELYLKVSEFKKTR